MRKYKITAIKNGITQSTIYRSRDSYDEVYDLVWKYFYSCDHFHFNDLMMRQPDFVRVSDVTDDVQSSANAMTA